MQLQLFFKTTNDKLKRNSGIVFYWILYVLGTDIVTQLIVTCINMTLPFQKMLH